MRRLLGSLRARLTLTYVALLTLLLAGLGAYQYLTLQRSLVAVGVAGLRGDLDEALASTSPRFALGPRTGGALPGDVGTVRQTFCTGTPAQRTAAARTLAFRVTVASGRSVDAVILDRNLSSVARSAGTTPTGVPRLSSEQLDQALSGQAGHDVVQTPDGPQLVAAFPLTRAGNPAVCGVAQLSLGTSQMDDVLAGERRRLIIGGAGMIVLAIVAGLWLTGRMLDPLRRLTATARRLAAGDLRARSHVPPRDDEVGTLAHSFDDMAERIETSFAAQAESEARMRRFIADASHELRTPVTALKGYIDVLRRGAAREPEALEASLGAMSREAERMRGLVLDLLTLARIDAQRPLELEPVDLDEVISAVLDDGVPGMPEHLERDLHSGAVVRADRGSVITIARNLLVNACKYAPGAAQRWTTSVEDGQAAFQVLDEGPGISSADLPHVFERFYRGEKTRAREEGGSGLGLSIAQSLARAMAGEMTVSSVEGRGTTVTVRLPTHPGGAAAT